MKWVPFVKLALSPGNRAHFGSKMDLFSAFPHYVFNDCGPKRGFHSDFALSPIQHCKNSDFAFQVLASCEKVNIGQNALFCSIWTQTWSAKKGFFNSKHAPFPG